MARVERLIIDTDAGIDDAVAIALALRSPEVSVCAITTTYGNNTVGAATRNVRTVLARVGGARPPVLSGAATPLSGFRVPTRPSHGTSGMGNAPVPPAPRHVVPDPAALARAIFSVPAPVTLVTIGPLTNLAYALRANDHELRRRVRRHVSLGGMVSLEGSADPDDFNASVDPDATAEVLAAGLCTVLVPVDAAKREVVITEHEISSLTAHTSPLTSWLGTAIEYGVEYSRRLRGVGACSLPDVAAVAAVIAPGAVSLRAADAKNDLDAANDDTHTHRRSPGQQLRTAFALDDAQIRGLLRRVFGTTWCTRKGVAL